jgi:hypothetical protein
MKQDATESAATVVPTTSVRIPLVTFTLAPPTIEWFDRDVTKPIVGKRVMLAAENGRVCFGNRAAPLELYYDERGRLIESRITHWAWVPVAPRKDPRE